MKIKFYSVKLLQALSFWIIMMDNAKSQPMSTGGSHKFLGAELFATVSEPGKLKVSLQIFYSAMQLTVPEIETVNISENEGTLNGKHIELKKEYEFIDVKYAPVGTGMETVPPSVKAVLYTGTFMIDANRKSCDVNWIYTNAIGLLNNIDFGIRDVISLVVHIGNVQTVTNNIVPTLYRLPVLKVNSNTSTNYFLDVRENGETDKVDVVLSTPLIAQTPTQKNQHQQIAASDTNSIKKATYRKGFSMEMPMQKSFVYNKETREVNIDHPSFGNYLIAISITDYRNQIALSQHQAIFIIESVL